MSSPDNYTYYQQRAATERRHAEQAGDPVLARLHEQLAEAYEAYVAEIEARPPLKLVGSQTVTAPSSQPDSSEQVAAATG
jgi:hypothetical protein